MARPYPSGYHGTVTEAGTEAGANKEAVSQSFECPRCHRVALGRFYGPCGACRAELNAKFYRAPASSEASTEPFEPPLHVVPNHIAAAREVDIFEERPE